MPASAMRPAKTEITAGGPPASADATTRTWSRVISAVAFTETPAAASRAISGAALVPDVSVTGILT